MIPDFRYIIYFGRRGLTTAGVLGPVEQRKDGRIAPASAMSYKRPGIKFKVALFRMDCSLRYSWPAEAVKRQSMTFSMLDQD
jgi:hypothetical protein